MDSKTLTMSLFHQVEDTPPLPEALRARMRLLICDNAVGNSLEEQVADAEQLMYALGVHPNSVDIGYATTNLVIPGHEA